MELDEIARGLKKDNLSWREIKKRFPNYDAIEIQEQGLTGILEKELQKKWNVSCCPVGAFNLDIPFSWLSIYPPHATVTDVRKHINEYLVPKIIEDINYKRRERAAKGDTNFGKELRWDEQGILDGIGAYDAGFPNRLYIPISKGTIPILIDIGGLSEKSQSDVKEQVWDIVKEAIKKRRTKKSEQLPRIGDPTELKFIYSSPVFEKHLKWYDMHMTEHLLFRDIARKCLLETVKKEDPTKAIRIEELIRDVKKLDKRIQKEISQIGCNVEIDWENAVEKEVKKFFKAIHREDYPSKKKADITFCPVHGNWENCPENCNKKIFDQRYRPMSLKKRRYYKDTNSIPDPKGQQPPAKSKQRKIMDLQNFLTEDDE